MFGRNILVKKESEKDGKLNINSMFYTIQGEGPNAGEPALFIRLQGCNLKCSFCDTEFDSGESMAIDQIVKKVNSYPLASWMIAPLIVITGGEPMVQADLPDFVRRLLDQGFRVQLETAGTLWQEEFEDFDLYEDPHFQIVCSPKTGKINKKLEARLTAYKYVLTDGKVDPKDGLPNISPETGKSLRLHRPKNYNIPVYVMPCDEHDPDKNEKNEQVCVDSVLKFGYRLCLQMHKHLGLE